MMPETGLRTVPVRRPVLIQVRKVRNPRTSDLASTMRGPLRPGDGECVIDGGAGPLGQGLVGEPVDVPLGLAGAGLPEQRGDLLERDASGATGQRDSAVPEVMQPGSAAARPRW